MKLLKCLKGTRVLPANANVDVNVNANVNLNLNSNSNVNDCDLSLMVPFRVSASDSVSTRVPLRARIISTFNFKSSELFCHTNYK